MRPTFNPRDHIRQLEDGREYLDLKWRILWLRSLEPDASIETQLISTSEEEVVCRTSINLRSGASVTAHGSALRSDNERAIEEAENRAMIRALASLGYGAEYTDEDEIQILPSLAPPVTLMTARTLIERNQQDDLEEQPQAEPPEQEPEPPRERPPDRTAERTAPYEPSPPPRRQPASSEREEPQEAEDISWTKFWAWAKPRGYGSAVELGELLNVDVLSHTPGEIRRMIKRYELEHPPGEDVE